MFIRQKLIYDDIDASAGSGMARLCSFLSRTHLNHICGHDLSESEYDAYCFIFSLASRMEHNLRTYVKQTTIVHNAI